MHRVTLQNIPRKFFRLSLKRGFGGRGHGFGGFGGFVGFMGFSGFGGFGF